MERSDSLSASTNIAAYAVKASEEANCIAREKLMLIEPYSLWLESSTKHTRLPHSVQLLQLLHPSSILYIQSSLMSPHPNPTFEWDSPTAGWNPAGSDCWRNQVNTGATGRGGDVTSLITHFGKLQTKQRKPEKATLEGLQEKVVVLRSRIVS